MAERRVPPEPVALLLAGVGLPPDDASRAASGPGLAALLGGGDPSPAAAASRPASDDLDARLEAVLLVATAPQPVEALATAVDRPTAAVRQGLERIRNDYDGVGTGRRRGFELREVATGWALYARAEHDDVVAAFLDEDAPARLSQAALETLAVVAYRQPVTRGQVAAIRAVSVDSVMRTLLGRGLIAEVGVSPESGATLFGTTDALLVALGIRSLADLPPIAPLLAGAEGVGQVLADVR